MGDRSFPARRNWNACRAWTGGADRPSDQGREDAVTISMDLRGFVRRPNPRRRSAAIHWSAGRCAGRE